MGFDRRGLDITDAEQANCRLDECAPDLLVNCAAYTAVERAEDEPDRALRVNADAVALLRGRRLTPTDDATSSTCGRTRTPGGDTDYVLH